MARNFWVQTLSAEVACVANTPKSLLQIDNNAAGKPIQAIQGVDIQFQGVSVTGKPILVKICLNSTAGTWTGARNPVKTKDTTTALLVTGNENATVEPTLGANLKGPFYVHPQNGLFDRFTIPDLEIEIAQGQRASLQVTVPTGESTVNALASLYGEE